jgi:DUF1680 family protein
MHQLSRRDALRLGALATAVPPTLGALTAGPAHAAAQSAPVAAPVPESWVVAPFANNQVTLRPSLFTANRDRILTFLGAYPADRTLANFRANAGLDTLGAQPPGGWDTADGNLRGHYSGHFMSALALASAGTGDTAYKDKLDYMVTALGQCQDALDKKVDQPDGPSHAGYLAAYPETQFIKLEEFATYPTIWAPWYTNHMIMRGLIDAYELTGNEQALQIVLGMADWAYSRLGHLPRSQLDRMWGIYIAGEYNAMAVVMAKLYGLTGNENYLTTAKAFDNTTLFADAVAGRDTIDGKHANQHIPQYLGYLEIFDQSGDQDYYAAAANFWDMVVPHRIYTDGGMAGRGEIFGARDVIASTIQDTNAETCPCYNMLKLSRGLFFHDPNPKYMQYYERALFGQILASRQNVESTTNPRLTYFVPMNPGARRSYGNLGTCCGGTGLESHTKFQDSIYFKSTDNSTLYVNLYLASTLNWPEKGFTIEQSTEYPADPGGVTALTVNGTGPLSVKLRVPYWTENGYAVRINGITQRVNATPGTYITLKRTWAAGDRIEVSTPFSLRAERALDDPAKQSIAYGPIPLVTKSEATTYRDLSFYKDFTLKGDLSRAITPTSTPMTFTTNGYTVAPFYINDTSPYHAYFTRSEPEIVFGSVDSGVANPKGDDGLTFLDKVWAEAPFRTKGSFVRTVDRISADWTDAGRFTREQRAAIVAATAKADLRS